MLIVARELPPELAERAANIKEQHANFHNLLGKLRHIKAIYILLLAAVTLLLIFSASWLALYVARGITIPIQALAEATDRVAHDDFAHPSKSLPRRAGGACEILQPIWRLSSLKTASALSAQPRIGPHNLRSTNAAGISNGAESLSTA